MKKRFLLLVWVLGILIPLFGIKKYHDLNNNEIALKIIAEIKNLAGQSLDLNYFDSEGVTSYDHKEWAQLLTKHVDENGKVNCGSFIQYSVKFTAYLNPLSQASV